MRPRTEPEGGHCHRVGGEMFVGYRREAAFREGVVMGRAGEGKNEEEAVSNVSTVKKSREP